MLKYILAMLGVTTCISGCTNLIKQNDQHTPDATWSLPKNDINELQQVSYTTMSQIYDDYMLENREVTLRDERLLTMRGIKTTYEAVPAYKTIAEWEKRKDYLKKHILVFSGLWPMPDKTPLHPVYYHKVDHDGYTVETVTIETYPGFLLAGNIYRPKGDGPFPAILSPHGHFKYGRLNNDTIHSVPARSINLARQGYVVFSYDMVGYNDTRQVSHTFASDSISPLYNINLLGLQLWNSIRALDFLIGLPTVDSARIGITGASGGATQVFLLTGVDDRYQASAPVNMVSNTMQGGDLCENAPGLRTNTFNVEIAAMVAPKPLLLVSDTHDWTFNTRNIIMPRIKPFYHLYNADQKIKNAHFDYVHNYNKASRGAAYEFFGKWLLHENDKTKLREKPFVADSDQNLLAFMNKRDADRVSTYQQLSPTQYHDAPKLTEKGFTASLKATYIKQLAQNWPKDDKSLQNFKTVYGTAVEHLVQASMPQAIDCKIMSSLKGNSFILHQLLIARKDKNDWIPCTLYQPLAGANSTVIVTADQGKAHFIQKGLTTPIDLINKLLAQKCNVLTTDLFKQGEHILQDSTMTSRQETDKQFTAYNLTDRQEQVQDLLTIITAIKQNKDLSQNICLYASGNTGITGLLLAPIATDLGKIVLDGNHFDPATEQNMLKLQIPGIMRIGGLPTFLALCANKHMVLYNANPSLKSTNINRVIELENNKKNCLILSERMAEDQIIDFLTL